MDISRLDPCDSSVDFWNSDTLNELVYYDSKVYVKLGMGDVAGAEQAAVDMQAILTEREIPEDGRAFSCFRRNLRTCIFASTSKKTRRSLRKNSTVI